MIAITLLLASCATPSTPWQIYAFQAGDFTALPGARETITPYTDSVPLPLPSTPSDWQIAASTVADVTGDGEQEWVLLVWRPWRDWRIQDWASVPSPISSFHDAQGNSCHLILLDPGNGHEIWAGSALPAPLLALAVGDVDGDNLNEVVALEGDYNAGRDGPAGHVNIWGWNDFGFSLEWRSPESTLRQLELIDAGGGDLPWIAVR